jgi:VanZ family protein
MPHSTVSIRAWVPVVLWSAVILIAATDTFSAEHSRDWIEKVLGHPAPELLNAIVRKTAHVVEYGILAALAWHASARVAPPLLIALAVASTDEFRQSLSPHRTGTAWDVLLDLAGAALVVCVLAARARRGADLR